MFYEQIATDQLYITLNETKNELKSIVLADFQKDLKPIQI